MKKIKFYLLSIFFIISSIYTIVIYDKTNRIYNIEIEEFILKPFLTRILITLKIYSPLILSAFITLFLLSLIYKTINELPTKENKKG